MINFLPLSMPYRTRGLQWVRPLHYSCPYRQAKIFKAANHQIGNQRSEKRVVSSHPFHTLSRKQDSTVVILKYNTNNSTEARWTKWSSCT